ncbi:MAG: family 43 glycosylhydrolase [Bacteroidales bacterium]|nr:family 43 glycosylhydrolase [Bacteroidales bacterium]
MKRLLFFAIAFMAVVLAASAQNPYLPLWEHIPDGEPYVFEDPDNPGKYRVYVYGSHDSMIYGYCGREQVVWSAPVEDLSAWRYDGVILEVERNERGEFVHPAGLKDVLYAPDVAVRVENGRKMYYLYPNNQEWGRNGMVAKSDRPDGPFKVINWSKDNPRETVGDLRFDPAVFVDDDGRVYGYWGFEHSYAAELDPETMATVKEGAKVVSPMISSSREDGEFRFFEASSIRKIKDKYVFIYSRVTKDGENGLPGSNYTLAYAYSNAPLGPYKYGGTIIDARAIGKDRDGKPIATANPTGNTHGSICEINGQWYVFYHRQTGTNEYARQAMVAPVKIEVKEGKSGYVKISEGEYTSEGFATGGLDPFRRYPAGIACYYTHPRPSDELKWPEKRYYGSYMKPTYWQGSPYNAPSDLVLNSCPVINNTAGSVVGYKYFNFDELGMMSSASASFNLKPLGVDGKVEIIIGSPWKDRGGIVAGELLLKEDMPQAITRLRVTLSNLKGLKGKQPVYLVFTSSTPGESLCELYDFRLAEP